MYKKYGKIREKDGQAQKIGAREKADPIHSRGDMGKVEDPGNQGKNHDEPAGRQAIDRTPKKEKELAYGII